MGNHVHIENFLTMEDFGAITRLYAKGDLSKDAFFAIMYFNSYGGNIFFPEDEDLKEEEELYKKYPDTDGPIYTK